jgi:hypothetical protein
LRRDGIAPADAEGLRGDLDAWRGLPALVLARVDATDDVGDDGRVEAEYGGSESVSFWSGRSSALGSLVSVDSGMTAAWRLM